MVRAGPPLRRPRADRSGIVAVEFALIAPVMALFLAGLIEMTNIIRVQAKLNVAAGQLAELVAGQSAVIIGAAPSTAMAQSLSDLCAGAAMNMLPYNTAALQASVDSVTVDNTSFFVHPDTMWTTDVSCGATSYHAGQTLLYGYSNSPRSLYTTDGTPYGAGGTPVMGYTGIIVQMRYQYANVLPKFMGTSLMLTAAAVARPRSNATVTCTTNATTTPIACPQNP